MKYLEKIFRFYIKWKCLLILSLINQSFLLIERAINAQALVGNIGGYLGLFMGYSILQFPTILQILAKKLQNWGLKSTSKNDSVKNVYARKQKTGKFHVKQVVRIPPQRIRKVFQ